MSRPVSPLLAALALSLAGSALGAAPPLPNVVDFNRDIKPILADNCFKCHGPDKNQRKAELRLDTKTGLLGDGTTDGPVVPGKLNDSELYQRITEKDPDRRMPAAASGKTLTARQIALLKLWIEQGAEWKGHWAYIKPVRPAELTIRDPAVRNEIDRFILAKLKEADLRPSPEADRVTLIRRLSFDLTGLPPTRAQVAAFVNDKSPDAYEKLVDRLLDSPHYGERMAMYWLDLVRYADSIGYHSDNPMNVSPYRDYIIRSFNVNKRFDRFTLEQLAGDLLPDATLETRVGSAYNRLLQTTEEGGAQPKEYMAKYDADRVRNVSSVWLGQTMGCCQCHDHKFDPMTTKDFYSLAAFFADIKEAPVGRREPGIPVPTLEQQDELRKIDDAIAVARAKLEKATPELDAAQKEWEKLAATSPTVEWKVLDAEKLEAAKGTKLMKEKDGVVRAAGTIPAKETYTITVKTDLKDITGIRLEALPDPKLPAQGPGASDNGNFVLTEFRVASRERERPEGEPAKRVGLSKAVADHSQTDFPVAHAIDGKPDTGWAILPHVGKPHTAIFEITNPIAGGPGTTLVLVLDFQSQYAKHQIGKFRLSATTSANPCGPQGLPPNIRAALAVAADKRSDGQRKEITAYFRSIAPALAPVRAEIAALEERKAYLLKDTPTCLVSVSVAPRTVRIYPRGNWLDDSGLVVRPAIPAVLAGSDPINRVTTNTGRRLTRLDLAKWLVDRDNPLTARVFVNRLWKIYFGQGLSKSLEDLGSQGELPTHPELLDWLAVDFMASGWDVKRMVKMIVMSGTYRQSSRNLSEKDPFNRLLARQSRYRLDAEMVRDNALSLSGLLSRHVGGPSVKPYQPPGYWAALNFPPREWQNDTGTALYRRGLYTHWQRSFPHPSMVAFDAPSREECIVERPRSNIPQQALVLLNDPTYVEAARVFAERIVKEGGKTPEDRAAWALEEAVSRKPADAEVKVLAALYAKHYAEYAANKDAAAKVLAIGSRPAAKDIDPAELAAWTSVARAVLNLHEVVTRE
jgi:hypothetical protein